MLVLAFLLFIYHMAIVLHLTSLPRNDTWNKLFIAGSLLIAFFAASYVMYQVVLIIKGLNV